MNPEQIAEKYCKLLHYEKGTIGWNWLHDLAAEVRNQALEEAAKVAEGEMDHTPDDSWYHAAETIGEQIEALKHKDGQP